MSDNEYVPSFVLRFVERDGSRVLQQLWISLDRFALGGQSREWRDVPLVQDDGD